MRKLQSATIRLSELKKALEATVTKRGSVAVIKNYSDIMRQAKSSEMMLKQWKNYQKDFEYASDIAFGDTCDAVVEIMDNFAITSS